MKTRFAATLLALALPLCAQEPTPVASPTEATFYKAFYLERGPLPDFAGAMVLYEQFLNQAPEHALAKQAAIQQYGLLDKTGKNKERDAFKAKYAKLLADVPLAGDRPARPGPEGAGSGQGRPGRPDAAARMAELEKELAAAMAAGDEAKVKEIEAQIARLKQMGERRGPGGGRGVGLFSDKKLADMSAEELTQLKGGLERATGMVDRLRERIGDEQADQLADNLDQLKAALDANKLEDAQKALDAIRAALPQGGRRGGAGGNAGGGGGEGGGGAGGRQRGGDAPR